LAFFKEHLIKEEKVDFQFKGLATAKNHIVVWNGKIVKVFDMVVDYNSANLDEKIVKVEKGNFSCAVFSCAIFEQNIYTLEPSKVNVRTFQVREKFKINLILLFFFMINRYFFQGTVKQVLQFTELEGDPFLATINGTFLAVGTTQGVVKIFDLSRR
jgi:intraflagellar transport protein 140